MIKSIDLKASGFYDNGGYFVLDLYAKSSIDYKTLEKMVNTNNRNIKINKFDNKMLIQLESKSATELYRYQKTKKIKFNLETI